MSNNPANQASGSEYEENSEEDQDLPIDETGSLEPLGLEQLSNFHKFPGTAGRPILIDDSGRMKVVEIPPGQLEPNLSICSGHSQGQPGSYEDPAIAESLKDLESEFGLGNLISQEITDRLEFLASGIHGRQLAQPIAALKTIEACSGPGKQSLALNLSGLCKWGVQALFAGIGGMEAAVTCVTSTNADTILSGLSLLVDNLSVREEQSRKQALQFKQSMNEFTRSCNEASETFSKYTVGAEQLLLTLQDVQAKGVNVPLTEDQ